MPSERFINSGGAFGLYDDIPTGDYTLSVPVIGEVGANFSINSGLHNTLIANFTHNGVSAEVFYGPHQSAFNTNVSVSGAISAEFLGFDIDVASIEVSGNGFVINVGGQYRAYTLDNLNTLTDRLLSMGVNQTVADSLTSALAGTIETLAELEDTIQDLLNGNGIAMFDGEPAIENHDGNWDPIPVFATYTLNDEGDRLGADQENVYTYTQDDDSFTIYDYSEDQNAQDVLVLEDVTADQVGFSQNNAHDLVITMSGGATVTINNHFLQPFGTSYHAIELVTFSDGTALTADEIAGLLTTPGQYILGTSGNDTLTDTSGSDTIDPGNGDDTIFYTSGDDIIKGHKSNYGNDTLDLSQYTAGQVNFRIVAHDVFIDTPDGTIELGYQVRYELGHTRSNIENIIFSDGTLDDAAIRDRAIADQTSAGDDIVTGSYQTDAISSGAGNDTIYAGSGDDTIIYTSGDDVIIGNNTGYNYGNDTLDLSQYTADQVSFRTVQHDVFIDTPDGSIELDYQVRNELGDARLNIENITFSDSTLDEAGIAARAIADQASSGDDVITGSYQSETITGGAGNDTLNGVSGSDRFVFTAGDGVDLITDYDVANDALEFTGISFIDLTITQTGSDVLIEYGTGDQVTVAGALVADFVETEFLFA